MLHKKIQICISDFCLNTITFYFLRIVFWFGKHYETPLLIQSILMNICMFALVQLCVKVNTKVIFPFTMFIFKSRANIDIHFFLKGKLQGQAAHQERGK